MHLHCRCHGFGHASDVVNMAWQERLEHQKALAFGAVKEQCRRVTGKWTWQQICIPVMLDCAVRARAGHGAGCSWAAKVSPSRMAAGMPCASEQARWQSTSAALCHCAGAAKSWRRSKAPARQRREYKTAADVLAEAEARPAGPAPTTIIDMRGPQVCIRQQR